MLERFRRAGQPRTGRVGASGVGEEAGRRGRLEASRLRQIKNRLILSSGDELGRDTVHGDADIAGQADVPEGLVEGTGLVLGGL